MSITVGDKVRMSFNGNVEDGYIIGIRPFRGQPKDYTTVWIEFINLDGETKPAVQVVVREAELQSWSISQLESWLATNAENHSKSATAGNKE
jgi:hypothetical protein